MRSFEINTALAGIEGRVLGTQDIFRAMSVGERVAVICTIFDGMVGRNHGPLTSRFFVGARSPPVASGLGYLQIVRGARPLWRFVVEFAP
jgi:hypothetical protein